MDAAEYKHVVLGLIFLKHISDAFEEQHAKLVADKKSGADPRWRRRPKDCSARLLEELPEPCPPNAIPSPHTPLRPCSPGSSLARSPSPRSSVPSWWEATKVRNLRHSYRAATSRQSSSRRRFAEQSFGKLKKGVLAFINKTHFDRITMILRSAGFVTSDLIGGRNAVNFAYILYLRGRAEGMPAADLERLVRRWYAMSILRGRYTGSPETAFDFDIRQVEAGGLASYADAVIENELPVSFWTGMLPQLTIRRPRRAPTSSLIKRRR